MKLAIDLQSCETDSRDRGIGRYSLSLAASIAEQSAQGETVLVLDAVNPDRMKDLRRNLRKRGVRRDSATFGYPAVARDTDLHAPLAAAAGMFKSRLIETVGADVVLVTSFFEAGGPFCSHYAWNACPGVRRAVVAYDLIPALFPGRYLTDANHLAGWYREKLKAFAEFDLYLAISEATRTDLITQLGIDESRVRVIGAGLDEHLTEPDRRTAPAQDAALAALGIYKPFVLMVGNADWRKNSLGTLEAFAALPSRLRSRHQLVFTRVGSDVSEALAGPLRHLRRQVVLAGNVDEATLKLLYARCTVFFFPSFYEGFGLPVLEAMALGAPVLTSNLGSLPEVVHIDEMLFDPRDADASAAILRRALEDPEFRERLRAGGISHARSFTWDKCASAALVALRELAAAGTNTPFDNWVPDETEIVVMVEALNHLEEFGVADGGAEQALRSSLERVSIGSRRRILIDISEVVRLDARSGIQRVVRNYCIGLVELARATNRFDVEPICWSDGAMRYARGYARDHLGLDTPGEDLGVNVQANDLVFMVDSSWWSPERFDLLHAKVRNAGGEIVWMVYDLVPILTPQCCDPGMPPAFKAWLEHVGRTADGCICISNATRVSLDEHFEASLGAGAYRPWTSAVHLGADLESGRAETVSPEAFELTAKLQHSPVFVAVGTLEPRKDYRTILEAFKVLWRDGYDAALIIIGKQGWNVDELASELRTHPEAGRRLHWLEGLGDGDVRHRLLEATALVQASIAEGYGLPVAEAGSLGIPLVLSDLPVFREIAGDQAVYFDVESPAALAQVLARGIKGAGFPRPSEISLMTWAESSEKLAGVLLSNPEITSESRAPV